MNYELCNYGGNVKMVVFDNGLTERVIKMKGKEIFRIPNQFLTGLDKNIVPMSFENKIKDAVLVIMNGEGDFIRNNCVFRCVDRTEGEILRLETIQKYKDAKFGYILKYWHTGYNVKKELIKNGIEFCGEINEAYYESIEEAENHKKDILKQAKVIVRERKDNLKRSVVTDIAHSMYNDVASRNVCASWNLEVVQEKIFA